MDLIYIGKIVNTHGIKGELRLLSSFEFKERVFKPNKKIYINNKEYVINTYRHHKMFDMITLKGFTNINEVLFLKNQLVYFNRLDLNLTEEEYLITDLIGLEVYYNNELKGIITNIELGKNPLIIIDKNKYVPYQNNFIQEINLTKRKIILKNCEGLL